MLPTIDAVAALLGKAVAGYRFSHCNPSTTDAGIYEQGERFHCFRCGKSGNSEDYLLSLGYTQEQLRDLLSQHFPAYEPFDKANLVDPLRRNLTPFVQACHVLLATSQDPRIEAIRQFALVKWGLTMNDILTFQIGVAITPLLKTLDVHTIDALNQVNAFASGGFKLNRFLIFPQYHNGWVDYFQGRNSTDDCSSNEKHWKPTNLVPKPFGYYASKQMIKRVHDKPLIIVEGVCDYYTMTKLGYPSVALLSANIATSSIIAPLSELYKGCAGAIIEFDKDATTKTGETGAENLCRILCENGIDAIASTVAQPFTRPLPPELHESPKLDVTQIVTYLGVEAAAPLFEEKFLQRLGRDFKGQQLSPPDTFLRRQIARANSQAGIDNVYRLLAAQPPLMQSGYFKQITAKFSHKETQIVKTLKRFTQSGDEEDLTILEEDEDRLYKHPCQSYKYNLAQREVYATKAGFVRAKRTTENDTEEVINLLCIITVKQEELPDGSTKAHLVRYTTLTPEAAMLLGKDHPNTDLLSEGGRNYWAPATVRPAVDPYCIIAMKSGFESAFAEVNIKQLYCDMVTFFNQRIHFHDNRYGQICALYCLMTYVFEVFEAIPYMHIRGATGTGKSELFKNMFAMSYMPLKFVVTSAAAMFRTMNMINPTMFLDEAEFMNKVDASMDKDLYQLNNVGYKKGTDIIKMDTHPSGKGMVAERFRTFGPKVFASIGGFYETIRNRCIPISTVLADAEQRAQLKRTHESEDAFFVQSTQNKLMVWSLGVGLEMFDEYSRVRADSGFDRQAGNRLSEIYAPILTVLRVIGDPLGFEPSLLAFIGEQKVDQGMTASISLSYEILRAVVAFHGNTQETRGHVHMGVVDWSPDEMVVIRKAFCDKVKEVIEPTHFVSQEDLTGNRIIGSLTTNNLARVSSISRASTLNRYRAAHPPVKGTRPYYQVVVVNMAAIRLKLKTNEESFLNGPNES